MTKTKMILIVSFLVTAAAGIGVGMLVSWPKPRYARRSRLAKELNLSSEQQEQMRKIWSEVRGFPGGRTGENRRALTQERDKAIIALLSEEQLTQYQQIVQKYERKLEELSQKRRRRFQEAVELTKQILTPEQANKYEELLNKRGERDRGRGRGWRRHSPRTGQSDQQPARRGRE